MARQLTQEARGLAEAIHTAAFSGGPLTYGGRDLRDAVAGATREVEETFTPDEDPENTPVGTREEVEWWASIDACRYFLTTEEIYGEG